MQSVYVITAAVDHPVQTDICVRATENSQYSPDNRVGGRRRRNRSRAGQPTHRELIGRCVVDRAPPTVSHAACAWLIDTPLMWAAADCRVSCFRQF